MEATLDQRRHRLRLMHGMHQPCGTGTPACARSLKLTIRAHSQEWLCHPTLLVTKRHHGVDFRGAACGEPRG